MKKIGLLIFVLTMSFLCLCQNVEAQISKLGKAGAKVSRELSNVGKSTSKTRNVLNATTERYTKESSVLVKMEKGLNTKSVPPKVTIVPPNTSIEYLLDKMNDNHFFYFNKALPRGFNKGDSLRIFLGPLSHLSDGSTAYYSGIIVYDESVENYLSLPITDELIQTLANDNKMALSIAYEGNPRPIYSEEFYFVNHELGRHQDDLFENKDTFELCKNDFVSFLNAHEIFFKDGKNKYSINTKNAHANDDLNDNKNKVVSAFYSFLKRWKDLGYVKFVSKPSCLRFLKQCDVENPYQDNTWVNWFRKAYDSNGPENAFNKAIDKLVDEWFADHGLIDNK